MISRWFFIGWILVISTIVSAQNAPVTTVASMFNAISGNVTIPVTVNGFSNIAVISLDLKYDPSVLTFVQGIKNSAFSGSFLIGDNILPNGMRHLIISWFGSAISLPDGTSILDLKFNYTSGSTELVWTNNGGSCEYADNTYNALNDLPTACYYKNGIVTSNKCLNLSLFLEGLYDPIPHKMNSALGSSSGLCTDGIADNILIELHNASDYSLLQLAVGNIDLSVQGLARVLILPAFNSTYYITIRHRNSIATTSALPVSFAGSVVSYNFTNLASKAFGNNMIQMSDGAWALYAGDVNQDGIIDSGDMAPVENEAAMATSGYISEDVNGDGLVDSSDMATIDNNAAMAIGVVLP
ncbi:MAG: dockerin type I domain-containing protein [Bacteroidota bacterium]